MGRDLLARWIAVSGSERDHDGDVPVVYADGAVAKAVAALASLAAVSAESREHQTRANVLVAFAGCLPRMAPDQRELIDDAIRRVRSGPTR
jgi:hypothetical protein